MSEETVEYIRTNHYQTKLTEELRASLSKEVWTDLLEFIESVGFINYLISPEEIRGFAKDRPKDESGKIVVDITKPHILEDMDFFRERALYHEKHGRYTHLRPNPNPKSEYTAFWKEELRRWRDGLVRPSDGEWIPGGYYFYLNYSPIWLVEEVTAIKGKKSRGARIRSFPKVWLGDYLFFHYLEQARENGSHAKIIKCRGVGFSFKLASLSPRNMYVEPGLPNFHLASDKTFLDGEKGVFGKVLDNLDWIADSTPLPKMRLINSTRSREIQLGFQDEYGVKRGLKSSVYGISLKDNPDKARGIRGPLIHYEEDGLFPNLEHAWNVNRDAVEQGEVTHGQMVTGGTGGCVTAGNKVITKNGEIVNIELLDKSNGIIGFNDKLNSYSLENISYWQQPKFKECIKITTNTGRWIECSTDHPIYTLKKRHKNFNEFYFKDAIKFRIKDEVAILDNVEIFGSKKMWNPRLVGLLIGDGSYGYDQSVRLSNCDEEILSYVENSFDTHTNLSRSTLDGKIYKEITIKKIRPFLRELGIINQVKNNKTLPDKLHEYSINDIRELIGGFYDADGYVNLRKNKKRDSFIAEITLSSSSFNLMESMMFLLNKFGIHGRIRTRQPRLNKVGPIKDVNPWYDLTIADSRSLLLFSENITLLPKQKNDRLKLINKEYRNIKQNSRDSGIRLEHVVRIENVGFKQVYNLTADNTHTYIVNGIITHNTSGSDFEGSEKLFRNPLAYNIYGIPNVFDKNSSEETVCGFFWGSYMNREKCYDPNTGEPDVIKALVEVLVERHLIKYNSADPQVITQRMAEKCITPSEAVMRTTGTIFPVADLKDYRDSIRIQGQRYFDTNYIGDLILTQNGVEWKPNADISPIRKFPVGTEKPEGAIEIFEMPKVDGNGKIDPNRYILGQDGYDDDHSSTNSLGSIFVFDLYTDRIVAEYTGRPKFANDFYEICRRLSMFYNGKINYEAHPYSQIVRLPSGEVKSWGDIKVGDKLFAPNNKTVNVIDIPIDEYMPIYRILLNDGREILASDKHLWSLYKLNDHPHEAKNYTTSEIIATGAKNKYKQNNFFIPNGGYVEYEEREIPIDSYTMGIVLAEGCLNGTHCTKNQVQISSSIIDMDFYKTVIPYEIKYSGTKGFSWNIVLKDCKEIFNNLGLLNSRSETKFIPVNYLYNSYDKRLELLKGLMDGDGCAIKSGSSVYITSSKKLADDILVLCRGLGFNCNCKIVKTKSLDSYRITIFTDKSIFKLPRKISNQHIYNPNSRGSKASAYINKTAITSVEFSHYENGKCVTVDSEDGLYLIGDYVVTHNCDKKGLFAYFDQKRSLNLLCDTPQILRDMDYVKGAMYGNKSKGTNSGKMINTWGRRLQRDWLLSPAYMQDFDSDGNQIGEKLNMHTVRSIAYLEELIAWNQDGNFDRVSACGMLMIYREDRLKYIQQRDNKTNDDDYDEYIDKNFQNAYQGQNSYGVSVSSDW